MAGLELGGRTAGDLLSQLSGLPVLFVRKAAKEYGTCRLAEGGEVEGRRLAVIEDVVTSGGQVVESCRALRERGAEISRRPVRHRPRVGRRRGPGRGGVGAFIAVHDRASSARRPGSRCRAPEAVPSRAGCGSRAGAGARPGPPSRSLPLGGEEHDRVAVRDRLAVLEADLGHVAVKRPGQDRLVFEPGQRLAAGVQPRWSRPGGVTTPWRRSISWCAAAGRAGPAARSGRGRDRGRDQAPDSAGDQQAPDPARAPGPTRAGADGLPPGARDRPAAFPPEPRRSPPPRPPAPNM